MGRAVVGWGWGEGEHMAPSVTLLERDGGRKWAAMHNFDKRERE